MMNNIELYVEFLENNLDTEAEQSFAENFAIDSEFRDEFRKFIKLSHALKTSSAFYVPPETSRDAVFSSIGFSLPEHESNLSESKVLNFFRGKLFSSTITCIATVLIMLWLMHSGILNEQKNQYASVNSFEPKQNEVARSQSVQKENVEQKKSVITKNRILNHSNTASVDYYAGMSEQNDSSDEKRIELAANVREEHIPEMKSKTKSVENAIFIENKYKQLYDTIYFIRSFDTKFKFEFKNTPSWFVTNPKIQPYILNKFNNLSVALYYPIYKGLSIGGEFREETFYVEYDGINTTGQVTKYYQQPNLSTFGLTLRYGFFDLGKYFKPYGQIQIGANTSGLVTRELAGIEYYPFDYVYFLVGGEYNQFYFMHDKKWFNAQKFSINYGIGIKF